MGLLPHRRRRGSPADESDQCADGRASRHAAADRQARTRSRNKQRAENIDERDRQGTDCAKTVLRNPVRAQVLAAIAIAIALGHYRPSIAVDMKPLGDGFIKLIKMVIALVIFCTVVSGTAGMSDIKKVSRVGGKALLYFEVVSTLALLIGFLAAHIAMPGAGFNVDPATLDAKAVAHFAGKAKEQTAEFVLNIISNTVVDAFARGDILSVVLVPVLFGFVLACLEDRASLPMLAANSPGVRRCSPASYSTIIQRTQLMAS
ncbi:hypothetical protein ABIB82_005716 [Bradyrhizobium sp. i1.8.4]